MQFTCGGTRWVILTDKYAFKIARFRPFGQFVRFLDAMRKRELAKSLSKHDANVIWAALKYLLAGMVANRNEHRLYRSHPCDLLAPTLTTIFWLVNIQVRGQPVTETDISQTYLFAVLQDTPSAGVLQDTQFCRINGHVCLADYGGEGIEPVIVAYEQGLHSNRSEVTVVSR